jgi:hypothetical protein
MYVRMYIYMRRMRSSSVRHELSACLCIRTVSLPAVQGVHQKVMFVDNSWRTELLCMRPHAPSSALQQVCK